MNYIFLARSIIPLNRKVTFQPSKIDPAFCNTLLYSIVSRGRVRAETEVWPFAVLLYETCFSYNKMWRFGWVSLEPTPLQNYIDRWVFPKLTFSKITHSIGVYDGHFYWPIEERLSRVCTERD